jgi:hypothetical protein
MTDPNKGKTPTTRSQADAEAGESGDAFEDVGFLEDSHALLEKIKATAENVTTCQVRRGLPRPQFGSTRRRARGSIGGAPGNTGDEIVCWYYAGRY